MMKAHSLAKEIARKQRYGKPSAKRQGKTKFFPRDCRGASCLILRCLRWKKSDTDKGYLHFFKPNLLNTKKMRINHTKKAFSPNRDMGMFS